MAMKPAILSLLVFVLVQATRDVPCVSARHLLQTPGLPFGLPRVPVPNGVPDLTGGLATGLGNAIRDAANATGQLANAAGGSRTGGLADVVRGAANATGGLASTAAATTGGLLGNAAGGVANLASGLANAAGQAATGLANTASNVLGAPPLINPPSPPAAAEAPGTTITESFYISTTGLGSTTVTATTHIPPLNEIRFPDFKAFVQNLLPKPAAQAPAQH